MATIRKLVDNRELFKVDPALKPSVQELRLMYASEWLRKWTHETLPTLESAWNIETPPVEQLDALINIYASGDTLTFSHQFWPLSSAGRGVWELKTADLRVFGWFFKKDIFIGVVADTADRIKTHNLYEGYQGTVVRFRDNLNLDEPKFVPGGDPNDIVSNYSYP